MAVGMDMSLPRTQPSPLRNPQAAVPPPAAPPMLADRSVQGVVNNQLAAGGAAGAAALRESDRRGISRGRGHQYMADIAQQGADMQGKVAAAQTEMEAAGADAAARQAHANATRNEQLASANLLEGLRSATAMERVQRQGWQQSLYEAMRRGQFGLDQQSQMDFTPLLQGLFR